MRYAVVALVLGAGVSDGAVLCTARNGTGTVRVREACRPKEKRLDPAAVGLQGPPGPAVVLKASDGSVVGIVLDADTSRGDVAVTVVRTVAGVPVVLRARAAGFIQDGGGFLEYESADCAGQAWFAGDRESPTMAPGVISGQTLYFQTGPRVARTYRSNLDFLAADDCAGMGGTFTPPDRCCFSGYAPSTGSGSPFGTFDLSGFVPPFHVETP